MCVLLRVKVNLLEFCWNSFFALEPWSLDDRNKRNWFQVLFLYKQVYLQKRLYVFVKKIHTWKVSAYVVLLEKNELIYGLASENRYVQSAEKLLGWIISWFRQVLLENRPSKIIAKISSNKPLSEKVRFRKNNYFFCSWRLHRDYPEWPKTTIVTTGFANQTELTLFLVFISAKMVPV